MSFKQAAYCDGCKKDLLPEEVAYRRLAGYSHKQLHACSVECRDDFDNRMGVTGKWYKVKQ